MSRLFELDLDIYLRKSRKDIEEERKALASGEHYDTLDRHRNTLLALVKKERHNIRHIYEEVVSGESVTERPRIQEMLRSVEAGTVDAILVMDLDRLGRGDMLDQGLLDRAFRYSGTKIITPTEVYDPESDSWELVFGIKSLVAREELKAITRRMQGGRVSSASEGKSISKKPPYGYQRDENLHLFPDIETAWVVKKIFDMTRDGHGRQAIANELDKLGVKPPNDKRDNWSPSSITSIIKNEVYIGNIIWGQLRYKKQNGKYMRKRMPRSSWTIKENAHEPIVSKELFEVANHAHTGRWRPSTEATKKLSNPMAGVLKCAVCGYTMLYQPRKNRPNDVIHCVQPKCKGKQKGSSIDLVENVLLELLKGYANTLKLQASSGDDVESNSDIPYKKLLIEKKEEEIAELNEQKSKLHDLLERGVYSVDTFLERQQNLVNRIETIQEEINNLSSEIEKEEINHSKFESYLPKLVDVIYAYEQADIERKNELLKSVLEKATYLRKKEWTKQGEFELRLYPRL